MKQVKDHFEKEAEVFDELIKTLIPFYDDMVKSLILSLPFNREDEIKVLDLGCGTGNISKGVKDRFPNAQITSVDMAENMIQIAKSKLSPYRDIEFKVADFRDLNFQEEYDAVISSLALHHLRPEEQESFYHRIKGFIKEGGVFYNADNITGTSPYLNQIYMDKWVEFILETHTLEEVEKIWLPKHREEDSPSPLRSHIQWMEDAGFHDVDVVWKYYYFGVYGGRS
ncbi:class I SAM-dependent methyltransferase [Methanobacterium petrolearium]|uniref:class I SAM-dependent methyltransferase n=1 Tax=Methanobacterium petrolearium TaxID=710190 RepID=UPI001AE76953|nr:class I SAM-dependent methyltransferase [Methanobacterium petrolearium]MBP1946651.1 tRNA (cmo5U34)-methyltransferase [Methanobacterium petrolearium]